MNLDNLCANYLMMMLCRPWGHASFGSSTHGKKRWKTNVSFVAAPAVVQPDAAPQAAQQRVVQAPAVRFRSRSTENSRFCRAIRSWHMCTEQ